MKCLTVICLSITVLTAVVGQPAKRFAGFGLASLPSIGGNLGCVVTGNKLFVNGLEGRDLTAAELTELQDYQKKLVVFREELKQVLEERRKDSEDRRHVAQSAVDNQTTQKTPQAPPKPSFCSEQATTQYIFDGCKLQNNIVYVGNTYARKLNEQEIEELKQFDKEMTAYQKSINANLEQRLNDIFAGAFSTSSSQAKSPEKSTAAAVPSVVEPPKSPNFCTLIF